MIYELEPDEFQKTRRIFEPLTYHLAVDSIIEGFSKARVFADDTASPKSAVTWFKSRAWIAGNANNDAFNRTLSSLLTDTYYRELSAHGAKEFRLHYTPGWQMKMDLIFGDLPRIEGIRYYFHLDAAARKWESVVIDDFRLCLINTEFLVSPKLRNLDYVIDEMQSERSLSRIFFRKASATVFFMMTRLWLVHVRVQCRPPL